MDAQDTKVQELYYEEIGQQSLNLEVSDLQSHTEYKLNDMRFDNNKTCTCKQTSDTHESGGHMQYRSLSVIKNKDPSFVYKSAYKQIYIDRVKKTGNKIDYK